MKIGRLVDIDHPVNLSELKPLERIVVSATYAYRNTDLYKRRFAESEEQKEAAKRKQLDTLINIIQATIMPFDQGNILESVGDEATAIVIEIPPRYKAFLDDAIASHEFDAYRMHIVAANELLAKHANIPALLYIEKR